MKAGFFSPLPPARTGVAEYAAALLAAMRRLGDIEADRADADVCLYHLGNNHLHREIYQQALKRPGVAVLHDAVLHHFFLGTLDQRQYIDEFIFNYGAWSEDLARSLWRNRGRSAAAPRYFSHPMLRRIAETSRAVIVHNPGAAEMVRSHAPQAEIHEIPHLIVGLPEPPLHETERFRVGLGVRPSAPLFAAFGHLRESKRLFTVLRAFRNLHAAVPDSALLLAGEIEAGGLARALEPVCSEPGILRRPFAPEPEFTRSLAAADVVVNLRYPPAGETSGIAIRAMSLGKAVILTEGPETSRFPADACVRIEAGLGEEAALTEAMLWLARFPEHRRELGRRASKFVHEKHTAEIAARLYWEVLTLHSRR